MTSPLYVFDLDETLIAADSGVLWNQFMLEKGLVTDPAFLQQDAYLMQQYAQGELDIDEYLAFCLAPLEGLPKHQVDEWVAECVATRIAPEQFLQAKQLISELKQQDIDMLIISATVSFIVHAVAKQLGIEHSLGIDVDSTQGSYRADIVGVPSYREGKVVRLQQWLEAQGKTYSSVYFYTDSVNDVPMCEYADQAFLVNPCPRLQQYAQDKPWHHLAWHKPINVE
ncbi:HAD family hydrolase [Vibrio hippocampi]|uniref:Phosphatase n=1 Tax=Vibrio hippocampi TaxID=654686 RepID=A0ABN8DGT7_9VIBR|nr:HAD family hydrolase [Vibrio hippocampi]CAH0525689.1 putative phosphatase [Vibrio hippocampi]